MSKERELLKRIANYGDAIPPHFIYEIKELLAQPEQEPEAWILHNKLTGYRTQVAFDPGDYHADIIDVIPLYTGSPKREPLSDDEMRAIWKEGIRCEIPFVEIGRAIEKAHGIGGGG